MAHLTHLFKHESLRVIRQWNMVMLMAEIRMNAEISRFNRKASQEPTVFE